MTSVLSYSCNTSSLFCFARCPYLALAKFETFSLPFNMTRTGVRGQCELNEVSQTFLSFILLLAQALDNPCSNCPGIFSVFTLLQGHLAQNNLL